MGTLNISLILGSLKCLGMILPDTKHCDALLLTGLFVKIIFSLRAHEALDLSIKRHFNQTI